ncbi:hypothetical protein MOF01_10340 [Bacillus spizizenii]|nr:hypothetical protein [Bacillus spizizenii]
MPQNQFSLKQASEPLFFATGRNRLPNMILWQDALAFRYLTGKEMPVDDNV